ncbi:acyl-CoA dehydrogenase [Nocardioides litoris]|uniref:acyl-CoA dehydrogenase n=1 Tax=Nocardioides litoris TaxID=1926648 RepID=UPI001FE2FF4B|nr:acyl-CoA dehydrogenase [Nocardioides litoris]
MTLLSPIAIAEDQRELAQVAADLLERRGARAAGRALLDAEEESLPPWWAETCELGWTGLHLPEEHGGSGFSLLDLAVVVEQHGRTIAPGPFVPTVAASAALAATATAEQQGRWLPGLAAGTTVGALALAGDLRLDGSTASGDAGLVLGGGLADLLVLRAGDDLVVVEATAEGVTITRPQCLDRGRRSARVTLDGATVEVVPGAAATARDLRRTLLAAEAAGLARTATEEAAAYARERQQFGRPIAMFQAVKHHCADMAAATELTTAAAWDAARAAASGGDQLAYAAAVAATVAAPAVDRCANLGTQVHGGIAITWEHDAHLVQRRATTIAHLLDAPTATDDLCSTVRAGTVRARGVELPPEAAQVRAEVREVVAGLADLDEAQQRDRLLETGYAVPHWPRPWGRAAGAVEQLVIEQELADAGVRRPSYGITSWNVLTVLQHGTPEQAERWVGPALRQEEQWCQLFSEPAAGSDAAGVTTRAVRTDGGWVLDGQKVWTSGAHRSAWGFATVRTDPDAPKHRGITTMVVDMHADGVEVRPIVQANGASDFNEVFLTGVHVPDDQVVGEVDRGWTVARATLGNESVSIGGSATSLSFPADLLLAAHDDHPDRLVGGSARVGAYVAGLQAVSLLDLRSAQRSVEGGEPGPEGAITKLALSELGHDAAAIMAELAGEEVLLTEDGGAMSSMLVLMHRAISIAGGTSEIKRNQIGERILGLPRDPLLT